MGSVNITGSSFDGNQLSCADGSYRSDMEEGITGYIFLFFCRWWFLDFAFFCNFYFWLRIATRDPRLLGTTPEVSSAAYCVTTIDKIGGLSRIARTRCSTPRNLCHNLDRPIQTVLCESTLTSLKSRTTPIHASRRNASAVLLGMSARVVPSHGVNIMPTCEAPLEHTSADEDGATLATLNIDEGIWRATDESESIQACYNNADAASGDQRGRTAFVPQDTRDHVRGGQGLQRLPLCGAV